jgi:hypothetical protein
MSAILTIVDRRTTEDDRQEVHQMLELYAAGAFAPDPTDPRNLFHERALREARLATEFRELTESRPRTTGPVARVRAAIAGLQAGTTTQACPCPA